MDRLPVFAALLVLTLALLAGVVVTGFAARRRLHIPLVGAALVALVLTIVSAVRTGEHYDLQAAGAITPIHLAVAKIAAFAFLLPIATGIATLRKGALRRWHRRAAFLALSLAVAAVVTGTLMIAGAPTR